MLKRKKEKKKKRKREKEKKGQRKQFETHPFGIEFSPFDISKSDATIMCYWDTCRNAGSNHLAKRMRRTSARKLNAIKKKNGAETFTRRLSTRSDNDNDNNSIIIVKKQ